MNETLNEVRDVMDAIMKSKIEELTSPIYDSRINASIVIVPVPVESSNVKTVGYDEDHHVLEIEFIGGGIYRYYDIPKSIWDELMRRKESGESIGSYLYEARVTGRKPHPQYFYRKVG